ncbi:MAG: DM13 domain-containing protein [Exilibacterium sp.]
MFNRIVPIVFSTLLSIVLVACGGGGGGGSDSSSQNPAPVGDESSDQGDQGDQGEEAQLTRGKLVYAMPNENGNTFACATCHALSEPAEDGLVRPGHPIGNALRRQDFKNGQLTTFLEAANVCLTEWMVVPTPWTSESEDFQALKAYIDDQDEGEGVAESVTIQFATPLEFTDAGDAGGDPVAGENLFNERCIVCHGESAQGTERAPDLRGFVDDANYVATKVRLSGRSDSVVYPDLAGGRMPFWGQDRISDAQLVDVISFLLGTTQDPNEGGGDEDNDEPAQRECSSTHPKIGQVASFETHFHDIQGIATIIDDCSIRVDSFYYDGEGIDVHVYGGIGSEYRGGFSMGKNLVNRVGYEGESFIVQLPENKTLDDLDRVSIWCVPVGVSFADAVF